MPNIHHELIIGASPEKVYTAITTQEGLSAWWTPGTKATPEHGSVAHFVFGHGYFKEMKIIELIPFTQVAWLCIQGAGEWLETVITFKLQSIDKLTAQNSYPETGDQMQQQENDGNKTLLIFHHDDWKEYTPMFAECSYTWAQFLRSLKLLCETGKGRPWPNQHHTE